MKTLVIGLSLIATFTTAASAESAWEGSYAGASFATFSGENTYDNFDGPLGLDLEGEMFGGFAGYSTTLNGFILGGEIAVMGGEVFEEGYKGEYEFTSIVDLKARAGYDAGQFMPYAVIGIAVGNFSVDDAANPTRDEDIAEAGVLFGAGIDIATSQQFTVGAEFASRSFDYEFESGLVDMSADATSVTLRGAYKF
ncbi:outer membrane protein [Yoonia sp. R2-816]|uniref:outer membrane protein n=1 Tax=Yoonia sp. R2-816 TaxID=3342638 RepID=UPI00372CAC34